MCGASIVWWLDRYRRRRNYTRAARVESTCEFAHLGGGPRDEHVLAEERPAIEPADPFAHRDDAADDEHRRGGDARTRGGLGDRREGSYRGPLLGKRSICNDRRGGRIREPVRDEGSRNFGELTACH
jgi:hypothetical protein